MTQWHIYIAGVEQPGLTEAATAGEAVEIWKEQNHQASTRKFVYATSHIPYNPRTRRNVSRSPKPEPGPEGSE